MKKRRSYKLVMPGYRTMTFRYLDNAWVRMFDLIGLRRHGIMYHRNKWNGEVWPA